jgi:outer membrane protein TolC
MFIQTLTADYKDEVKIGIVLDGARKQSTAFIDLLKEEIADLTSGEFEFEIPESKIIDGDWNINKIKSAIDQLLADKDIDIILALGVIASNDIAKRDQLNKPVIAPYIFDIILQGIPEKNGTSGIKNLTYIYIPFITTNTLSDFQNIVDYKNLAILLNNSYLEAIPGIEQWLQKFAENRGINLYTIKVEDSIDAVFQNLPAQVDAVYVSPLLHIYDTWFDKLIDEFKRRKMPSFSILGIEEVKRGILATNRPDIFPRVARRIALNVQRILLGEKPGEIPVFFAPGEQLTINMETARAINTFPKLSVLSEAELVYGEEVEAGQVLNLNTTVDEAIRVNLDVLAKISSVSAGSENIRLAWANLLPQLDISATGLLIDKDRAEASFGSQAERTITGSIRATQLIFSEPAWANLSIQKSIQNSRESELEQVRLDIGLAASNAFFNVLRAKTFEKIQKENLKRTKSNLGISRVREAVGSAGPAEVYRWESELANNRNAVIRAMTNVHLARIDLNRLLHRDLEERFIAAENNVYSQELMTTENIFHKYLDNPNFFSIFQNFLVEEGLKNSPELVAIEAIIKAQERTLSSATNRFWAPTLALQAEYSSILSKSGAGSEVTAISPGFSLPDDKSWNIALDLSFPLFNGTGKFATTKKAHEELEQLNLEYQSVAEKLEQQIRSTLYIASASFAAINQTKLAAQAANKTLQVIQDAYSQGMISILDLLDAQNTTLISEELASNAVYDFIIDLITAERAVGQFYFQMNEQQAQDYLNRLEAYLEESGF